MPKDKRVDAYIAKSPDWAKPILVSLRATVHETVPEVSEDIKWGHPTFMHHGIMCGMIAFKNYATFHFWKGSLIGDDTMSGPGGGQEQFGKLTSVKDLPPKKKLVALLKKAAKLNEDGVKVPKLPAKKKADLPMPDYFMAAIEKNKKALAGFEKFSPSHKREYVEWITEAKTEPTRDKRVAQAVEWMAEGKPRNWKYMK